SSPIRCRASVVSIGRRSCMHIVDFSPGMGHTRGFRYSAGFVQRPVTTVSIGLKHSAVTGKVILWMDTFPVRTVREPDRRGHFRTSVTVITDVDPQPGCPGFTAARLLDRDGDIIGMDFTGHQHILAQFVIQQLQQFSNGTCPASQRGSAPHPDDGISLTGGITADGLHISR
ncbi:hypothetical protein ERYG_05742, partial [Escherichia coli M114]